MNGVCYTIDLDGNKEAFIPISSIFKDVKTIILETRSDCMIGNVSEFQVFDGHIYILDKYNAKSMFVFDMEGRFLRKIGSLGRGPGEYLGVSDFTLDTENRIIYLKDVDYRVHKYQFDGTYVHSITLQVPHSSIISIQYYKGKLYSDIIAWKTSSNDYILVEIDPNDGKILSQALPLKYNKGWTESFHTGHSFFISRLNSPPRYAQLFMNYIVSIGEEITPYIELKSKYLVTEEDIENNFKKEMSNMRKNISQPLSIVKNQKIWDVHSYAENDYWIIFTCQIGSSFNFFTVLFHKETGIVKLAELLRNDLILRQGCNPPNLFTMSGRFKFSDRQGAYEVFHPSDGFDRFKVSIKNNEIVPDLDKLDQLKKLNEESNPVIFFYEFK